MRQHLTKARAQNFARLFFHGPAVMCRADAEARLGLFIEFPNRQGRHDRNASIASNVCARIVLRAASLSTMAQNLFADKVCAGDYDSRITGI